MQAWSDPADCKHHLTSLGLALCDVLEGASDEVTDAVIADLIDLLGEKHDRVAKAREKIEKVFAARAES